MQTSFEERILLDNVLFGSRYFWGTFQEHVVFWGKEGTGRCLMKVFCGNEITEVSENVLFGERVSRELIFWGDVSLATFFICLRTWF